MSDPTHPVVFDRIARGELGEVTWCEWMHMDMLLRDACRIILREMAKDPVPNAERVVQCLSDDQMDAVRAYNRAYSLWASTKWDKRQYTPLQYHLQCVLRKQSCNTFLCLLCHGAPMDFWLCHQQM